MQERIIQKRIQAKVEGEILKWGRCVCAICHKKGKMGSTTKATPQNPVVKIMCFDCSVDDIARRHNIPEKQAKERHEKIQKAQERLIRVIMERYQETTGKKIPKNMQAISEVVQPGVEWWQNGLSESERWEIGQLSKDDQKKRFRESPILPPTKQPIVNSAPDIGRNDPCPCGSGKKYKKCCLEKAA